MSATLIVSGDWYSRAGVGMSPAAHTWTREVGLADEDIRSDVHRLRTGASTREQLRSLCVDGASADAHRSGAGLEGYVAAVVAAAEVAS